MYIVSFITICISILLSLILGAFIIILLSPSITAEVFNYCIVFLLARNPIIAKNNIIIQVKMKEINLRNFEISGITVVTKQGTCLYISNIQLKCQLYKMLFNTLSRTNSITILIDTIMLHVSLKQAKMILLQTGQPMH